MTGICGAVGLDGRPVDDRALAGVLDRLRPIGPDGTGSWSGWIGPMGVAMGAARRRRVDTDHAEVQPLVDPDGVVAVGDVVLDNRPELCRALRVPDTTDRPDLDLVVRAYRRWGEACAGRLLGEVAVAVADPARPGVLLVRDHLGRRPLSLHEGRGWAGFASTALAVTGFDGVPAVIDPERTREFVALVVTSTRSWVRDVAPVPPATTVWIGPGGIRRRRYWELHRDPDTTVSFDEHVERLRSAFDDAVAARLRRLPGGTPAGVMLSGGLDSTAVAATIARMVDPAPVRTYTSVPAPGWQPTDPRVDGDESPAVRALAARYTNLRTTFLHTKGASLLGDLDDVYAAGGTPSRNTGNLLWTRLLRRDAAADGVALLFTGAMGNLAFSADGPAWLRALVRAGRPGEAIRELTAWSAAHGTRAALAAAAPRSVRAAVEHRRAGGADPDAAWLAFTALRPDLHEGVDLSSNRTWPDPDGTIAIMAAAAEWQAAETALLGLRLADPTASIHLLELCAAQPDFVRRRRGRSRAVCRAAMADRLPDAIRLKARAGIQLADWLDRFTDLLPEITDELAAARDHPTSRQVLDIPCLRAAVADWPDAAGPGDRSTFVHRYALPRALAVSGYLRWFEREAARPPVPAGAGWR